MTTLSEIISKQVLNIYSGKMEGTIVDAYFDKSFKKIIKLKIFDEDEEEYFLETNKIYTIGKDVCVIKNSVPVLPILNQVALQTNSLVNKQVFSTIGQDLGKIVDVEINNKFEVTSYKTTSTEINPNKILNIAQNIVVNLENKKINLSNFKPKMKYEQNKNIVSILPKIESPQNDFEKPKKEPYKINASPLPPKLSSNVQFLIGRRALKTIYGLNNEIIIKKDSLITTKNLENAKKHSKLAELTLYSQINA